MNWIDVVLLILLVAAVIVGSKKGLIREIIALVILTATVIVSINYIDIIAEKIYAQLGGSPLVTALLSFIVLLAIVYAVFKILGLLFYKLANLQKLGKKDQLGGAFVGAIRGWVIISFLVFLVFLIPMPDKFYMDFDESFLGPSFARTLPLLYESTATFHPNNPNFMNKVERALLQKSTVDMTPEDRLKLSESRQQVYNIMFQMDKYFGTKE
jgi:membrane protein required for colicin V production